MKGGWVEAGPAGAWIKETVGLKAREILSDSRAVNGTRLSQCETRLGATFKSGSLPEWKCSWDDNTSRRTHTNPCSVSTMRPSHVTSIKLQRHKAEDEHMACSDHFTTAWWLTLTQLRLRQPSGPTRQHSDANVTVELQLHNLLNSVVKILPIH